VVGGALAIALTSAPALGQETPEAPPEGGYSSYPNYGGEVDCEAKTFNGTPFTGSLKSIEATDESTVVFTLCAPDPAFLAKIAFSAFAINDADYLAAHAPDRSILTEPNGTGPYRLEEWRDGQEVILTANEAYWGDAPLSQTAVLRWSSEPGQKLIELQSGTVDGIDNPSSDDLAGIEGDPNLQIIPREDVNIFYIGMNNTKPPFNNAKIREAFARGIDRQRIVDQFYAEGSEVASHFTPCSIEFACEGEPWYEFDPEAAKALLAEGLVEEGMVDADGNPVFPPTEINLRVVDRTYLPFPEQVALDLQDQLMNNFAPEFSILSAIIIQDSSVYIPAANAGQLDGFHLLGWNADYPDMTNFLDYHFGVGAQPQFGTGYPEIHAALTKGSTTVDPEVRADAYLEANNAIRANVPMIPVAHGASTTAWVAGLEGAHSSPLANEALSVIAPGADDTLVFMQSDQPISLFCPDESDGESLRACEQIHESLYAYEVGGTAAIPSLATECVSNEDGSQWTCTLREGVTFHDGSTLDANDVVTSYAASWDALNPLHVGNTGQFSYFSALWGRLNPPPPAPA
jgi:ABC-type transport system substrate-binding protein